MIQNITAFLFFTLLLGFTAPARAQLPVYGIDLHFLKTPSPLQRRSARETDEYARDSGNQAAHPVWSEAAILDFGDRQVRVTLIASRHDGDADVAYLRTEFERLGIAKNATVFIEQGDPHAPQGAVTTIDWLTGERAPELATAFARARREPRSFFSPEFFAKLTFGRWARQWSQDGGHVVNMDLSMNFTEDAIGFLRQNVGDELALRFLRMQLDSNTVSFPEFKTFVKKVYPSVFTPSTVDATIDCCGSSSDWIKTFLADVQVRDLVRERQMRRILWTQLRDGDVLVTHPVHMKHLISIER